MPPQALVLQALLLQLVLVQQACDDGKSSIFWYVFDNLQPHPERHHHHHPNCCTYAAGATAAGAGAATAGASEGAACDVKRGMYHDGRCTNQQTKLTGAGGAAGAGVAAGVGFGWRGTQMTRNQ